MNGVRKNEREIREACGRLADSGADKKVFGRPDIELGVQCGGAQASLLALLTCKAGDAERTRLRGTGAGNLAGRALRLFGYRKLRLTEDKEERRGRSR